MAMIDAVVAAGVMIDRCMDMWSSLEHPKEVGEWASSRHADWCLHGASVQAGR